MLRSNEKPFAILTLAAFILLLLPNLVQDGMFMDGLIYACVSKNLSEGIGSMWHPSFSQTYMTIYHEQPPLMFWIQSLFFRTLGTSMYVERFYDLLTAVFTAVMIMKIWKKIFNPGESALRLGWLPVLLWVSIPVCFHGYIDNLEECTMSIWGLCSVYFSVSFLHSGNKKYGYLILSGGMLVLSSMTKGIQGLFPIAFFFFYWLGCRRISFRQVIGYTSVVFGTLVIVYGLLSLNPAVVESYQMYFHDRLVNTFQNAGMATTGNRLYLLYRLFSELIPALIIMTLLIIHSKRKSHKVFSVSYHKQLSVIFLLTGLSGVVPLMVTYEQRGFYLITTLPFFAISISLVLAETVQKLIHSIQSGSKGFRAFRYISILLVAGGLSLSVYKTGHIRRDQDMLHDVYLLGNKIGVGKIIDAPEELFGQWRLQGYFVRHFYISINSKSRENQFLLLPKNSEAGEEYSLVPAESILYDLYRKKN